MKQLDAVNLILPALGEHPVTTLESPHPTLAILLPIMEHKRRELLGKGWWFNSFSYTIAPNSDGEIAVPIAALEFITDNGAIRQGGLLVNPETLNTVFTEAVTGNLILDVQFDDLPESIASVVLYSSLVQAYLTDVGLESVVQQWAQQAQINLETATSMHLRYMRHSTTKSRRYIRYRNALRG